MNKRRQTWISFFCLLSLAAFGCSSGTAKQSDVPDSRVITLNVVATDKAGLLVAGLKERDFTLLDNKQPREPNSFHAAEGATAELPVRIVLVVDEVNDSFVNVAFERSQLAKYFQTNGGKLPLPVSLVFFTDSGATMETKPSVDGKALIAELNGDRNPQRIIRRSQGFYGANDRLQLSLRALEQLTAYETAQPGRKLVIWISPGWPLLSPPNDELTRKTQQEILSTVVGLSSRLRDADITLYGVDPKGTADSGGFRTFYYQEFLKGVREPSQVHFGNLGLQVLAYQSGGRVLNSNNDVASEIAACVSDVKAFYVLSFESAVADGPDDYHSIEIKIDKPGISARTRSGYYAQPEQTQTH